MAETWIHKSHISNCVQRRRRQRIVLYVIAVCTGSSRAVGQSQKLVHRGRTAKLTQFVEMTWMQPGRRLDAFATTWRTRHRRCTKLRRLWWDSSANICTGCNVIVILYSTSPTLSAISRHVQDTGHYQSAWCYCNVYIYTSKPPVLITEPTSRL